MNLLECRAVHRACRSWMMLLVFIQMLHSVSALALDPERNLTQYACRSWSVQNGFPGYIVSAITQTRDGFVWIGSRKGLIRSDGVEFKLLPLPATPQFRFAGISVLSRSADGGLWFGNENGAFGYYRIDQGFSPMTNAHWLMPGIGLLALNETRDGTLWVGTSGGVIRMSKGRATEFLDNVVGCISILEDSQDRVWLGSRTGKLFGWEGGKLNTNLQVSLSGDIPRAMAEDRDGRLWISTQVYLQCYASGLLNTQANPKVPIGQTQALCDSHGVLWVGTTEGLFRVANGKVTSLGRINGLADDYVSALFEDQEGNLWVGGRNGVSILSDVKLPIFGEEHGLPKGFCLGLSASAKGGLWAATSAGIARFNNGRAVRYSTEAGLSTTWVKRVFESTNGDLYIINGSRQVELFRNRKVVTRYKYKNEWPTALAEDAQGMIVAEGQELLRIDGDKLVPYVYKTNTPPVFGWIYNLSTMRDGSLLVATDRGVFRIRDGAYDWFTVTNGLPADKALYVSEDEPGVIWVGLNGGLARIEGMRVDGWTREDGLFDNTIRAIIPDDLGHLWIHSSQGIFSVTKKDLMRTARDKTIKIECSPYDGPESVKTTDTLETEYSACKTDDGKIWFPSPQGLIMVDPKRVFPSSNAPMVRIETVKINGKAYPLSGQIACPVGRGELEIQFTAPTFVSPHKQEFRYQLEGYDTGWREPAPRRSAFFANLRPGKYRFLVQAWNPEAQRGGKICNLQLDLLPFFYQTTWFYLLCGAGVVLTIAGAWIWRVSSLQKKQAWLEGIVQNRTAELKDRTLLLEKEIEERKRIELEVERAHRNLLEASRVAGMAEVATGVLHNVGNVLNSVNVSTTLLAERTRHSQIKLVDRAAGLLKEHQANLGEYLTSDPKGQQIPSFLGELARHLAQEQAETLDELRSVQKNVDHIKDIVAMQQSHAKVTGVTTIENVVELVEEALRMHQAILAQHQVELVREFITPLPSLVVDRHRVMQVLLNLLSNATHACIESNVEPKRVTVRLQGDANHIFISVIDNGIGIAPENLARIFTHGFTTRKNGHGFGLHSSALAAKEMGGELRVQSPGLGKGASFILELPLCPNPATNQP